MTHIAQEAAGIEREAQSWLAANYKHARGHPEEYHRVFVALKAHLYPYSPRHNGLVERLAKQWTDAETR